MTEPEKWLIDTVFIARHVVLPAEMQNDFLEQLVALAQRHGLAPLLYGMTKGSGDTTVQRLNNLLKPAYFNSTLKNSRLLHDHRQIIHQLHDAHIPVMPLKGIFLSSHYYADAAYRQMSDIDLLVPPELMGKAYEVLSGQPADLSAMLPSDHHLSFTYGNHTYVELHRTLFPSDVAYALPNSDIWSHATPIDETAVALKMDTAQMVVYLALHIYNTLQRGGLRLSWFYDLMLVAEHHPSLSHQELADWVDRWKVEKPFTLVIATMGHLCQPQLPSLYQPWQHSLSARQQRRVERMVSHSAQQDLTMSYRVAWERLAHTKGLMPKWRFIVAKLQTNGRPTPMKVAKRLFHLTYRSVKMLLVRKW